MSGRGEPSEDEANQTSSQTVRLGEQIFNREGEPLGKVRGVAETEFVVTAEEELELLHSEHARTGQTYGEAELMWRCTACGEMGQIDEGFPESCPHCGTAKQNIMYWTED